MITKKEWKEAAERRLAENVAHRVIIIQIEKMVVDLMDTLKYNDAGLSPTEAAKDILERIQVAKEIGN